MLSNLLTMHGAVSADHAVDPCPDRRRPARRLCRPARRQTPAHRRARDQRRNAPMLDIGVPTTNIRAIRCPMARTLALWMRDSVQPAARAQLGTRVIRIESFGAYACRRVIGVPSTKLSEHAQANAVDIAAFVLADGRRISVDGGWNGAPDAQRFLRDVRSGACARFATVLSPDFNAAHANHLHFDLGRGPFCR